MPPHLEGKLPQRIRKVRLQRRTRLCTISLPHLPLMERFTKCDPYRNPPPRTPDARQDVATVRPHDDARDNRRSRYLREPRHPGPHRGALQHGPSAVAYASLRKHPHRMPRPQPRERDAHRTPIQDAPDPRESYQSRAAMPLRCDSGKAPPSPSSLSSAAPTIPMSGGSKWLMWFDASIHAPCRSARCPLRT